MAAKKGFVEICKKVIEIAECKNPKDHFGTTPLHFAAQNGRVGVFQLLLTNVDEKNPKDNHGKTPIQLADGHKNILRIYRQFS